MQSSAVRLGCALDALMLSPSSPLSSQAQSARGLGRQRGDGGGHRQLALRPAVKCPLPARLPASRTDCPHAARGLAGSEATELVGNIVGCGCGAAAPCSLSPSRSTVDERAHAAAVGGGPSVCVSEAAVSRARALVRSFARSLLQAAAACQPVVPLLAGPPLCLSKQERKKSLANWK